MAAPVNLPATSKASPSPSVEKVSTSDTTSANGADHSGFSQVLHHQMDKQQSSTASASGKPADSSANSQDKQPVANSSSNPKQAATNAKSASNPAAQQQAKASQPQGAQQADSTQKPDPSQKQDPTQTDTTDAAIAAAMQTQAPMSQLRELVAASLHGNGQNGNVLPLEASTGTNGSGGQAEIMKLLALRMAGTSAQQAGTNAAAGQDMSGLPQGLQLLEQRIQKQIALESQQATGGLDSATPHLSVKQLQGLENALQSLAKANAQGDSKGLASAWAKLDDRLQQLQLSQGGNNTDSSSSSSDDGLTGMLKSLQQEMATLQQSNHLQAGESDKSVRLAFQSMLDKLGAQQQQLAKPAAQPTNSGANLNSVAAAGSANVSQSPAQQAAATQAPTTAVNVPVHNQAWGQALGERLQWMVKQDMKNAEIKLNPRHLGPIEVKIAMNQDQATVSFSAHHMVTKEALEAAMPKLKEMFGNNGINLINVNVSHHSGSEGQQPNANSQQGHSGGGHSGPWSPFDSSSSDPLLATDIRTPQWFGSNRMLDTYV